MTPEPPAGDSPRGDREPGRDPVARAPGASRPAGGGAAPANWGLALDLGMRLGIAVVIGLGLGLLVDGWLHTAPLFTLVGIALGVAAAMYTIWEVAREAMRR